MGFTPPRVVGGGQGGYGRYGAIRERRTDRPEPAYRPRSTADLAWEAEMAKARPGAKGARISYPEAAKLALAAWQAALNERRKA